MRILDCTLRDGGYCNEWDFGFENIKKIIAGLSAAGIEIVECGFLTYKTQYHLDITKFNSLIEIKKVLPSKKSKTQFVCMVNYGEYDLEELPEYDGQGVEGIRLAFHKADKEKAMRIAKIIKRKGYALFLQPMVSLRYSDEEFLSLIRDANELSPHAFYIVDSFGVMKKKDLIRLFCLVEHNLMDNIAIGFHTHNNMQLSYSNAQVLAGIDSRHEIIIDSSIYGMGRGAGNLNTELFVEYLNDSCRTNYKLKPLLDIIDGVLNPIYQRKPWGYSLPNYLSAKYNTHPNYAGYLSERKTLTIDNMDDIFASMDDEKRAIYDKEYIEKLYIQYLTSGEVNKKHLRQFINMIHNKTILVIAPGASGIEEKEKILHVVGADTICISVNFDYSIIKTDYIFLSNLRRYRDMPFNLLEKCIVTSNIPSPIAFLKMDYKELLNSNKAVFDNAGLMLIKLLIRCKCKKIQLVGFDGYSDNSSENFGQQGLRVEVTREWAKRTNEGFLEVLKEFANQADIEFLTTSKYVST